MAVDPRVHAKAAKKDRASAIRAAEQEVVRAAEVWVDDGRLLGAFDETGEALAAAVLKLREVRDAK